MPVTILVPIPAPTTLPRTSACSTARSCAWCRRPATRHPATPSADRARRAVGSAATCRARRPPAVRSCSPGGCAIRSVSPSTPTPVLIASSSTTSARAREKKSTSARSARTTAGRSARASARSARTHRAQARPCPQDSRIRSPTIRARSVTVITAGAFIPNGHWPAEYDGGYLFADAGSGNMWLRRANGTIDYATPFATNIQDGIADMAFVTTTTASRCTTRSPAARSARSRIRRRHSSPLDRWRSSLCRRATVCSTPVCRRRAPSPCGPARRATCRWDSTRP